MERQAVEGQLGRILASDGFAQAERARKFLRFIVEATLSGRAAEMKESVIAVEVLGRAPAFDPRTDPIVRVEAGRLRTKLLAYYQSEGSADTLVIDLPKGGYVPKFYERRCSDPDPKTSWKSRKGLSYLIAAALSGAAISLLGSLFFHRETPALREPVRLSILPPPSVQLLNSAISPDGGYLAFAANTGQTTQLWIRALSSTDVKPLSGTDPAAHPFWSPDSSSIGFFSQEKLKRIHVSGGPAQTICDIQAAFGGTWGKDDIILFAQRPSGIVFRVSAAGGAPKPVTNLDRANGDIAHVFPYFLPDGRHFLYSVISRAPAESSVRVASIDMRGFTTLLNADPGVAYAPGSASQGALLFAYHGALLSQPFDARTLKLSGTASQIAPQIRFVQNRAEISVSSNGVVAYQGSSDKDRQLTWLDRNGRELGTIGAPNNYRSMQLSPDERRLALQTTASGRREVWIMDLASASTFRLGGKTEEAIAPVWSPQSNEIAFAAATPSGLVLLRQKLDSETAAPVLETGGVKLITDWSSDGKFLVYSRFQAQGGIWIKPLAGPVEDNSRSLTITGQECCAVFSPVLSADGPRWIAYSSTETGQDEVYVKNFPAADRKWKISTKGGWMPHWRRDGAELFYLGLNGDMISVDVAPSSAGGFISGTPHVLFKTTLSPSSYPTLPGNFYAVSRDGQRFLVNSSRITPLSASVTIFFSTR